MLLLQAIGGAFWRWGCAAGSHQLQRLNLQQVRHCVVQCGQGSLTAPTCCNRGSSACHGCYTRSVISLGSRLRSSGSGSGSGMPSCLPQYPQVSRGSATPYHETPTATARHACVLSQANFPPVAQRAQRRRLRGRGCRPTPSIPLALALTLTLTAVVACAIVIPAARAHNNRHARLAP